MFEEFSRRNRAVISAMSLAATRDWGDITLGDIAKEANLSLADLRRDFSCKSDLLRVFQAEVDAQVLARIKSGSTEDSTRDRIFDTIMTRFDVLSPYKPALKRIACHLRGRPGEASLLACSQLSSHYWTLSGAGAKLQGPSAVVRVVGLAAVYGKAFAIWLNDDSPSLDKTMATLDRGLNNGERALENMERVCSTLCNVLRGLKQNLKPKAAPDDKPSPGGNPAPSTV